MPSRCGVATFEPEICSEYPIIADPSVCGCTHLTCSCPSHGAAGLQGTMTGGCGWSGLTSGRTSRDTSDGFEGPTTLIATTLNVYVTSLVSPLIWQVVAWPQSRDELVPAPREPAAP